MPRNSEQKENSCRKKFQHFRSGIEQISISIPSQFGVTSFPIRKIPVSTKYQNLVTKSSKKKLYKSIGLKAFEVHKIRVLKTVFVGLTESDMVNRSSLIVIVQFQVSILQAGEKFIENEHKKTFDLISGKSIS